MHSTGIVFVKWSLSEYFPSLGHQHSCNSWRYKSNINFWHHMTCHKTNIIFFFLFLQKNEVTGHLRNTFDIYLYHLVDPRGELINDRSYGSLGIVVCLTLILLVRFIRKLLKGIKHAWYLYMYMLIYYQNFFLHNNSMNIIVKQEFM